MATFGERFKQLRIEKRLTQQQLANNFYLNKSSISRYEQNKQLPEIDLLQKFADFFEVPLDYLLGRSNNRNILSDEDASSRETDLKANVFWEKLKKRMHEEGLEFDKTSPEDMILAYKIAKEFEKNRKSN